MKKRYRVFKIDIEKVLISVENNLNKEHAMVSKMIDSFDTEEEAIAHIENSSTGEYFIFPIYEKIK